jgi:hypothetical protein
MAADTLDGDKVVNATGEDLGEIKDIMIDVPTGRVAYAVLSFGGFLGTFTVRFPGNCSRFAPYVWVGGGGVWGGEDNFVINAAGGGGNGAGGVGVVGTRNNDDGRAMGQFGGGFEIRFTPHFGWQNDVSWNVVDGPHNNFGMARTGLNFAF